jgi:DNA-binding GntR family transcriptional regulator
LIRTLHNIIVLPEALDTIRPVRICPSISRTYLQVRGDLLRSLAWDTRMQPHTVALGAKTALASKIERERLQLSRWRKVLRILRVLYEGDRPRAYQLIAMPLSRVPGLDREFAATATLTELASRYNLALGKARERIRLVDAPFDAAMHLGIRPGEQKLTELDRVTSTTNNVPIEWRVSFVLGDQAGTLEHSPVSDGP